MIEILDFTHMPDEHTSYQLNSATILWRVHSSIYIYIYIYIYTYPVLQYIITRTQRALRARFVLFKPPENALVSFYAHPLNSECDPERVAGLFFPPVGMWAVAGILIVVIIVYGQRHSLNTIASTPRPQRHSFGIFLIGLAASPRWS